VNFVLYTYAYFVQKLCAIDNMSGVVVIFVLTIEHMVGGVAEWLGCRSVAGGLSLIYA